MGNQSHRENQQNKTNKISGSMIVNQNHWYWNLVFVCFLDGFGYPLILKSCFFVVFSMALATHWFWNLGFLVLFGFLDGFGYPLVLESWFSWFSLWFLVTHWSFLVNMCMLKVLFRQSETTHKLENMYMACCQKWCFPTIKHHSFWNGASRLGKTHCFNITYAKNLGTTGCRSHIYIYIYIYIYMYIYTCLGRRSCMRGKCGVKPYRVIILIVVIILVALSSLLMWLILIMSCLILFILLIILLRRRLGWLSCPGKLRTGKCAGLRGRSSRNLEL